MPPRRPLPDLCLIAIFKMQTPIDQLKASKMSPRCPVLVRAANRRVKMLVIASSERSYGKVNKNKFNHLSLGSLPVMQLLPEDGSEPFADVPMITRISQWNCLLLEDDPLLDESIIELIINAFSAVTDLKFYIVSFENMIALLLRPEWSGQLISLTVFQCISTDKTTSCRLIAAINGLLSLQYLAIEWIDQEELPDLTILAQLQMIVIDLDHPCGLFSACASFIRSLKRYAVDNVGLQIFLFENFWDGKINSLEDLEDFSKSLCSRIVRYVGGFEFEVQPPHWLKLPNHTLPSLTSFAAYCTDEASQLRKLSTELLRFPKLVHFQLEFRVKKKEELLPLPPGPPVQLSSVRAFELSLDLHSHSQLTTLPVTLPRLQAIHLRWFVCKSCGIELNNYLNGKYMKDSVPISSTAVECVRAVFLQLNFNVPHNRIILGNKKPYPTLEQLLSTARQ